MILTTLLIILILSVNVINTFALDGVVSPSSVHVHTFKRVVESIEYYSNGFNSHDTEITGFNNCTKCYYSEYFSTSRKEPHTDYRIDYT
jgi:hypothetical protein